MNDNEHPPEPIAETARELGGLALQDPEVVAGRMAGLPIRQQAELALRLPPMQRLELLLHAPKPMALVRALPDAEVYLTVREVGPADALPLLALASGEQLLHLIDLESWRKDRFDGNRAGGWTALLLEAGEPTLRSFLRIADDELLALLLHAWLRPKQVEFEDTPPTHGGESEAGDERGFVSPDGYYRFAPTVAEHGAAAQRLLQVFFADEPRRYERVMWSAVTEVPAELEEHALRWRQSRLEEHGFPPWDEAVTVYSPPSGDRLHPEPPAPRRDGALAAPRSPIRALDDRGPLAAALDGLTGAARERVFHEIVSVANHLLVADSADTGDPGHHRRALEKAASYVGIALSGRNADDPDSAARVLAKVPVLELFREGYSTTSELQRRVQVMVRVGWASTHPRAIELLDPPIGPRVAGLMSPRPLYLDVTAAKDSEAFREFRSPAEVDETAVAVEMAETVGELFVRHFGVDPAPMLDAAEEQKGEHPRFSTLLLTSMAWHATRDRLSCEPLPPDVTADFLRNVTSRRTAPPDAHAAALDAWLGAVRGHASLGSRQIAVLQAFGKACLERLSSECSNLDPGSPPDSRYVTCLLLAG